MSLRAFRALLVAGLAACGIAAAWWQIATERSAAAAAGIAVALEAEREVRSLMRAGADAGGAATTVAERHGVIAIARVGAAAPAALLDSMRLDEAPRSLEGGGGALVPLKDADDWDVIGVLEVRGAAALPRPRAGRAAMLTALLLLAGAAAWLWRWAGRAGEQQRRGTLAAWTFLGMPVLHLAVFSFGPVLFTFWIALHRWDLLAPERPFVGLDNFTALAGDELFWTTLRNTALYVTYVPVTMALALAAAVYLNRQRGGERILRAIVFMPYIASAVAIALVWQWMFQPDAGIVNRGLALAGLPPIDWLGSPRTALLAIILVTVWTQVGYQMIVFLAGLQSIPQVYLDAAMVDGASPWQRFRRITVPLLRPVILFVLVTGIISGFQVFTLVYMMTEGGPLHSTDVIVYRIYQMAWEFLRFGEASAMAVVLFVLLLGVTIVQFRWLGRRGVTG